MFNNQREINTMEKNLPEAIRLVKGEDNEPLADSRDVADRILDLSAYFKGRNFRPIKINDLTGVYTSHVLMTEAETDRWKD
jgi:hypothetical protein